MSFDEEPDDLHSECRHEIERLNTILAGMVEAIRWVVSQMEEPGLQGHTIGAYRHGAGFGMMKNVLAKIGGAP